MDTLQPLSSQYENPPRVPADHYGLLKKTLSTYLENDDVDFVEKAYLYAAHQHAEQKRRSGEPYINHPIEVALILAKELRADKDVVAAAFLHDTVEDTNSTKEDIVAYFGQIVADLVDGVTKLTNIDVSNIDKQQALNLRKMFLAMNKDIRVVLIKLADRLHNMRTLAALKPDRRLFKAQETMQVYAPLADRLGISAMKWELEDLAFSYLDSEAYQSIARMVQESRQQRLNNTEDAIHELSQELTKQGIKNFTITGRPKHLWSIYQKMQRKDKDFAQIYDLIALRVICETVGDCYSILGAVHQLWHPMPGRFKDYIATPKPNLYQSIHTTVVGSDAKPIEIQIRTKEMHEQAEYGIAAHWLYKSTGTSEGVMANDEKGVDSRISYIRRSIEWATQAGIEDPEKFLSELSFDLYEQEIFTFTPKGEVLALRKDSTPLDFAYAIHTEVGNTCIGAKVNGSVVPLTYTLQMGDRVEIMTNKSSHPASDWLDIVKTPGARSKIRRYFTAANKDVNAEMGRSQLASALRKEGFGISTRRSVKAISEVATEFQYKDTETLMAAIGTGKISLEQVLHKIVAKLGDGLTAEELEAVAKSNKAMREDRAEKIANDQPFMSTHNPVATSVHRGKGQRGRDGRNSGLVVKGDPTLLVRPARCCNPVAGDKIIGFITRGRGVSVHRVNCPNVVNLLEEHPERQIDVAWDTSGATEFSIEIVVEAIDRIGLLRDVTDSLEQSAANILSAATQVASTGVAKLRFLISISDVSLLDNVLAHLSQIPSVYDARRIMPGEGAREMKRRPRNGS